MLESRKEGKALQSHLVLLTFLAGIIPSLIAIICLCFLEISFYLRAICIILLLLFSCFTVTTVWKTARYQYRSLNNLLAALDKGDYTFRGATSGTEGPYNELVGTVNALATTLQKQRLHSEEHQLLLVKVINQIDVAIIAWDELKNIHLINPAASKLLGISDHCETEDDIKRIYSVPQSVNLKLPDELAFTNSMEIGSAQVLNLKIAGQQGRFRIYKERFISEGNTQNLLFITNVSNILRREEKKAWQNLIRVLSHEINNSLAPLNSLSKSLGTQVQKREQDEVLAQELTDGLSIIGRRADSLAVFVQHYKTVADLPDPAKKPLELKPAIEHVANLFPQHNIQIQGEPVILLLDISQFEQLLINLIKNAVEANESFGADSASRQQENLSELLPKPLLDPILEQQDRITISWEETQTSVQIRITDCGNGLENQENLFTPFYTTKKKGSGIGLVLSQQIIEAHNGHLALDNREDQHGCVVTIVLPLIA